MGARATQRAHSIEDMAGEDAGSELQISMCGCAFENLAAVPRTPQRPCNHRLILHHVTRREKLKPRQLVAQKKNSLILFLFLIISYNSLLPPPTQFTLPPPLFTLPPPTQKKDLDTVFLLLCRTRITAITKKFAIWGIYLSVGFF